MSAEPPPVSTSRDGCPPSLDRIVKKCLAKDPDGRWQDAGDLAAELQWVGEQADIASPPAASRRGSTAAWAFGRRIAAAGAAALTAWALEAGRASAIGRHGARHHRARTRSSVRRVLHVPSWRYHQTVGGSSTTRVSTGSGSCSSGRSILWSRRRSPRRVLSRSRSSRPTATGWFSELGCS